MAILKKNNILFGLVCFRERFWECDSFKSLLRSHLHSQSQETLNIYIFDNTDAEDWFEEYPTVDGNIKVTYHRDRSNPGISKAYNAIGEFAKLNHFTNIVFLDQDTELPEDFFSAYEKIAEKNVDIAAPVIFSNDVLISPGIYKNYRSSFYKSIDSDKIELEHNSCINSGLMVKTDFFYQVGGYNESLRLDFCDHEFIKRVGDFTKHLYIVPTRLEQNFSTDTNPIDKALFRYSLFTKDIEAFKKINNNDSKINIFVDLPHLIRLTLQYKSLAFFKQRFF